MWELQSALSRLTSVTSPYDERQMENSTPAMGGSAAWTPIPTTPDIQAIGYPGAKTAVVSTTIEDSGLAAVGSWIIMFTTHALGLRTEGGVSRKGPVLGAERERLRSRRWLGSGGE